MGKLEDELRSMIDFRYGGVPKFAEEVGLSKNTIYSVLRNGIGGGSINTVLPILAALGIDSNWVIKNRLIEVGQTGNEFVDVPLLGSIAAGTPIEMVETERSHPVPAKVMGAIPRR